MRVRILVGAAVLVCVVGAAAVVGASVSPLPAERTETATADRPGHARPVATAPAGTASDRDGEDPTAPEPFVQAGRADGDLPTAPEFEELDPQTAALRQRLFAEVLDSRHGLKGSTQAEAREIYDDMSEILASSGVTSGAAGAEITTQLHTVHTQAAMEVWRHAEIAGDADGEAAAREVAADAAIDWLEQAEESGKPTLLARRYCETATGSKVACARSDE